MDGRGDDVVKASGPVDDLDQPTIGAKERLYTQFYYSHR